MQSQNSMRTQLRASQDQEAGAQGTEQTQVSAGMAARAEAAQQAQGTEEATAASATDAGSAPQAGSAADAQQAETNLPPVQQERFAGILDAARLGELLRETREAMGVSLADAASALKLSASALTAMEEGKFDSFPHKAYAKGFLRSYAQYLKIPLERCQNVFTLLTPVHEYQTPVYTPSRAARPHRNRPWIGMVASLLIACLIASAVWYFDLIDLVVRESSDEPRTEAPMPSSASPARDRQMREREEDVRRAQAERQAERQSQVQGQIQPPAQGGSIVPGMNPNLPAGMQTPAQTTPGMPAGAGSSRSEGSPTLSLVDPGEREPLPAVVTPGSPWSTLQGNATIAGEAGLAEPVPAPEQTTGVNTGINPNLPPGLNTPAAASTANSVIVVAETMCWTSVTVDDNRSVQRTLQAGETLTLGFTKSLRLRLGNAGGVRVFYNGREIERGRPGQVRNMKFPLTEDGAAGSL